MRYLLLLLLLVLTACASGPYPNCKRTTRMSVTDVVGDRTHITRFEDLCLEWEIGE